MQWNLAHRPVSGPHSLGVRRASNTSTSTVEGSPARGAHAPPPSTTGASSSTSSTARAQPERSRHRLSTTATARSRRSRSTRADRCPGAGCSSTAGHGSSPRDGTRPPESASSTSTAPRGSIPHRSGRRHDPHARRRARHSVVSGCGSPRSSIQARSSPSPFRRRSAAAPGP
jgi:hypothetical protein